MQPIQASEIDLTHFSPVLADYGPKGILAKAVLVTKENIGKLALEFELDLRYAGVGGYTGTPFFKFMADRTADEPIELTVLAGFWIIELWEEIHIFRADIFENTFRIVVSSEPEQAESSVGKDTIGDPVTPRTAEAGGPFKPIISAEEWEQARKDNRKKLDDLAVEGGAQGELDAEGTTIIPAVEQPLTDREKEILENSPELRGGFQMPDPWEPQSGGNTRSVGE